MRLFGEVGVLYYTALSSAQSASTSVLTDDGNLEQQPRPAVVTKTVHRTCPTTMVYLRSLGWIATNGTTRPSVFSLNSSTTSLLHSNPPDPCSTIEDSALQSTSSAWVSAFLPRSNPAASDAPATQLPGSVSGPPSATGLHSALPVDTSAASFAGTVIDTGGHAASEDVFSTMLATGVACDTRQYSTSSSQASSGAPASLHAMSLPTSATTAATRASESQVAQSESIATSIDDRFFCSIDSIGAFHDPPSQLRTRQLVQAPRSR
ncbi:hypothetical protein DOTSEDRAFT_78650 [Dothistroma septosporum NZE10]|uniref:Uncharacterized protein n=1 Tax=Dothistroma septosporum (strain NZE10 / CBS 128990) TaxID=675120 RepID=N1PSA3_DOTSN|nr:hypothetical protein DOTSEDRAFT_78650 [Dothistroma septosporum NZE10]